jgi:drug/metabolite transporter (DMT)-like permease
MTFLVWILLGVIVAEITFVSISYNDSIRLDAWKIYPIGVAAGILVTTCWIYMIRHLSPKHIFFANFAWDITVTVLCTLLPIFIYGIKLDLKATVGCILAFVGIVLIHLGEAH